jgi:hypothetical protein
MDKTAWIPIAEGQPGINQILAQLSALKTYYGSLPAIRSAALAIASSQVNDDDSGNVDRLTRFVRKAVIYVKDPLNSEFTQTPDVLLLAIHKNGSAQGDCDDHVLLFASLAESLGIPVQVAGVKTQDSDIVNHVIAIAWPNGQPQQIDLCAKAGFNPTYQNPVVVE